MTVGEKLKSLRLQIKKTLKEESEMFNVSLNTVYRWEHNLTTPGKRVLQRIADFYNVSAEWLIYGHTEESSDCGANIQTNENNAERQLLCMFGKLSENNRYKLLGYIEHMLIEDRRENK